MAVSPYPPTPPYAAYPQAASPYPQGSASNPSAPPNTVTVTPTFWQTKKGRAVSRAGITTGVCTAYAIGSSMFFSTEQRENSLRIMEQSPKTAEIAKSMRRYPLLYALGGGLVGGAVWSLMGLLTLPFLKKSEKLAQEAYEKKNHVMLTPTPQKDVYLSTPQA
jgi:hypothetical protein